MQENDRAPAARKNPENRGVFLYLCKNRMDSFEQLIVFVEPKGTHLIDSDKWKEDFLLALKDKSIPTITFADDNKYKIWGFHFFNTECRGVEFAEDMETL